MATTRRCPGCSAPAALAGAACHYCGAPPPPIAADEVVAPVVEAAPADEAGAGLRFDEATAGADSDPAGAAGTDEGRGEPAGPEGPSDLAHRGWADAADGGPADPADGGRAEPADGGRADPADGGRVDPAEGNRGDPADGGVPGVDRADDSLGDEAGPPATGRIWSVPPTARLEEGAAGGATAEVAVAAGADEDLVAPAPGEDDGAGDGGTGGSGAGEGGTGGSGAGWDVGDGVWADVGGADEAPVDEARVAETPLDEGRVAEAPVDEGRADEGRVAEAPVDEGRADEGWGDRRWADEAPVDEAPVDGAPSHEGRVDEGWSDKGWADEAPADETADESGRALAAGTGSGGAEHVHPGSARAEAAGLDAVWADVPSGGRPRTERVIEVAAAAAAARAARVAAARAEPEGGGGAGANEIRAEDAAGAGLALRAPGGEARTEAASRRGGTEAAGVQAVGDIPSGAAGPAPGAVAGDEDRLAPPPAREARRIRGLLVPLVAAAVVGGIGYPLTTLAVARVGRLPATSGPAAPEEGPSPVATRSGGRTRTPGTTPGSSLGRVRLSGAVTYDGPATPVQCSAGIPVLVTFGTPADQLTIRLGLPAPPRPGVYPLQGSELFVAVSRNGPSWTTRNHPEATGETTVRSDRSVSSQFDGLRPNGGGAEGTVSGSLEVRCG